MSSPESSPRRLWRHRGVRLFGGTALVVGAMFGSLITAVGVAGADNSTTVNVTLTPAGCAPKPSTARGSTGLGSSNRSGTWANGSSARNSTTCSSRQKGNSSLMRLYLQSLIILASMEHYHQS